MPESLAFHRRLGGAELAYIGDAVHELHVRLEEVRRPGARADLHARVLAGPAQKLRVGIQCERTLIARQGFILAPQCLKSESLILIGPCAFRHERKGVFMALQRLVESAQVVQYGASVEERIWMLRVDGERPLMTHQRFLQAIQLSQHDTSVVMRLCVFGIEGQRALATD